MASSTRSHISFEQTRKRFTDQQTQQPQTQQFTTPLAVGIEENETTPEKLKIQQSLRRMNLNQRGKLPRYNWFAESNVDAGAKILIVSFAIISAVAAWYPYGLTAAGWTYVSTIACFVIPAIGTLAYTLILFLTVIDGRFFNNNLRWIISNDIDPTYRIGDRWFNFFNGLVGFLWNISLFLLWLTFYLNNQDITGKNSLLASTGFVTQPYAGLAAISFLGYFGILVFLFLTLYTNTASRENRDIVQKISRSQFKSSVEDILLDLRESEFPEV